MDANYLTLEFRFGGVYDKQEHSLNVATFSADDLTGTDWAILLVTNNPRELDGTAVVLAGYTGYGTNAAAVIFSQFDKYPELHQNQAIEALIRVKIIDGVVESPEISDRSPDTERRAVQAVTFANLKSTRSSTSR